MVLRADTSKGRCEAGAKYERYLEAVASLCDKAVQLSEPTWRNGYHASHIDHVQAVSIRLGIKRNSILASLTSVGYLGNAPADPSPIICETPSSAISNGSSTPTNSSASRTSSITLTSPASSVSHDSNSGTNAAWTNSSTPSPTARTPSSSPAGPTALMQPLPKKPVTFCPSCDAEFTGSPQNRTSNLRRHLRTVHHQGEPLYCDVSGCEKVCGRSDNLRKHRRNAHNIIDPVTRRSSSKRLRRSSHVGN